jgi:hypothetical protein
MEWLTDTLRTDYIGFCSAKHLERTGENTGSAGCARATSKSYKRDSTI